MLQETRTKTLPVFLTVLFLSSSLMAQEDSIDASDRPVVNAPASIRSQAQKNVTGSQVRGAFGETSEVNELRSCIRPKGKFLFSIEKAPIADIVSQISQLTCSSFIIDPSATGTKQITVMSRTPIDVDEAWNVFLSALAVNDIGLMKSGKYYKLVNKNNAVKSPIPTYSRDESVPNDEGMITMIYDVKGMSQDSALTLVRAFAINPQSVMKLGDGHVVFSDTALNAKRILKILEKADVSGGRSQIYIMDLNHAKASELQPKLEEVFGASSRSSGSFQRPATQFARPGQLQSGQRETTGFQKIIADDRTNRLIIIASEPSYLKIKEIIEELDVERTSTSSQSQIHVYNLANAEAEKIAVTLNELLRGIKPATTGQQPQNVRPPVFGAPSDVVLFEGEIKVTADKTSNALVVVATARDYRALTRVIEKLDKERVQVYIEAAIMEIAANDETNLGLEFYSGIQIPIPGLSAGGLGLLANAGGEALARNIVKDLAPAIAAGNARAGALAIPSFVGTFGLMGLGTIPLPGGGPAATIPSVGFLLKALEKSGNIDVLSTPSVMALDNEEAFLKVGRRIPQISGVSTVGTTGTTGIGVPLQTVTTVDAFLQFKITPHVNAENKIQMDIEQDISDVGTPIKIGAIDYFEITNKTAKTKVVARDQETVVIGGLINESNSLSESKTPILGDIPIIGNLFKTTTKSKVKKNLVLILTPHLVRSPEDMQKILDKKMKERDDLANLYFGDKITKYNPEINYDKKQGPLAQLIMEVSLQMSRVENGGQGMPGEVLISPEPKKSSAQRKEKRIDFSVTSLSDESEDDYYFEPQFMAPPNVRGGVGQPDVDNPMPEQMIQPVPATPEPLNNLPENDGNVQPEGVIMEPVPVPVPQ